MKRTISFCFLAFFCTGPALAQATANLKENLRTFDPQRVERQWHNGGWRLVAGDTILKEFSRDTEAQQALRIIQELHLNQHGTVGTPQPIMEYWLADGQAPQGMTPGFHPAPFDAHSLRVEQVQGQSCVRDNLQVLFNFGAHADEAQQALAVIRKYGFTQVGYVGQPRPIMLVFTTSGTSLANQRLPQGSSWFGHSAKPLTPLKPAETSLVQPAAHTDVIQPGITGTAPPAGPQQQSVPVQNPFDKTTTASISITKPNTAAPTVLPASRQLSSPNPLLPDMTDLGDRVPIDYRQVQVQKDGEEWKLVQGAYTLASFGTNEADARKALDVVQFYRFTEHCLVGRPKPVFSYFLVRGQAPARHDARPGQRRLPPRFACCAPIKQRLGHQ